MKPTASMFAEALKAFGDLVWDEVSRKPGPDLDDIDREAWRTQCRRLMDPLKRDPSALASWNDAGHIWAAGVWKVLFALRNAKYRPTWAEVGGFFEVHMGAAPANSEPVTGADAAARTVYTAPPPPAAAELPAGASDGTYRPPWLEEFRRTVSRDKGGPCDRQLIGYLSKMSDAKALETIGQMHRENMDRAALKAEGNRARVDKRAAADAGKGGRLAVDMACRELAQLALIDVEAAQSAPTPKDHWED